MATGLLPWVDNANGSRRSVVCMASVRGIVRVVYTTVVNMFNDKSEIFNENRSSYLLSPNLLPVTKHDLAYI